MKRNLVAALAIPLMLGACAPAESDEGAMEADAGMAEPVDTLAAASAVQGLVDEFLSAFNAGDASAASSIYAEDIVQMRPYGPVLEGREATIASVQEFLDQFSTPPTQTANTDEVIVRGDLAIARGTWAVQTALETGAAGDSTEGKWLMVARRQGDGSWKISRWIWNQEPAAPDDA